MVKPNSHFGHGGAQALIVTPKFNDAHIALTGSLIEGQQGSASPSPLPVTSQ
jgi:hypothetical protein